MAEPGLSRRFGLTPRSTWPLRRPFWYPRGIWFARHWCRLLGQGREAATCASSSAGAEPATQG